MPQFFPFYSATDCPADIYQKYLALKNAPPTTRAPVTAVTEKALTEIIISFLISKEFILPCNIVATIFFLFVLFLNQKKYNKSYALNLFCWFYIGIQLILCCISIFKQTYLIIWRGIWDANIICQLDESVIPPKIARYSSIVFPRWYYLFDTIRNNLERSFYFYILPLLLGFHRTNIYFACSHPLIYKKYLKESQLKYYYFAIGAFGASIFVIRLFRTDFLSVSYAFDAFFAFIQIISCSFHIIITMLAVQVMLKYRKIQSNASLELKGFFYFSILPMLLSIISMCVNILFVIVALMIVNDPSNKSLYTLNKLPETVTAINDQLIVVLSPIFASFLMLLCIPAYQKSFKKVILRQHKIESEGTIKRTQNTVSVSSKISTTVTTSKRVGHK